MGRARKATPSGMPGSTGDTHATPAGQRKGSKRTPAAGQQQQKQPRPPSQQGGEASLPSSLLGQQQHANLAAADTRRSGPRLRGASRPPVKRARKEPQQHGPKVKGGEGSPAVSNGVGTVKGSGAKTGPGPLPVDSGGGRGTTEGPDATQKKPRRQWELWSAEDKNTFFQSLFEHGKDFEAIQNDIAKRYMKKGHPAAGAVKNKEQVRHFYYRTWHSISKHIDFENVFCRGMAKSSQELYGLICYGELRKKMGGCMHDRNSAKLNELIQLGVTTLRHNGRKLRIKAPMCRALKKICDPYGMSDEIEQKRLKLPTKVCVELQPRTNSAWTRVQSVAHNPRLRMMVELHRKVSHLIEFLKEKWAPKESRVRISLLQQQQQQQQQSGEAKAPTTSSSTMTSTSTTTSSSSMVTSSSSTTTSSTISSSTTSSRSTTTTTSSPSTSSTAAATPTVAGCPPPVESSPPDERPQLRLFPPEGVVVSPLPCVARVRHSRTMCTVHWQEQSRVREPYVPPQAQLMRSRPQLLAASIPQPTPLPPAAAVVVSTSVAKNRPVPGPAGTTGKGQRGSRAGASGQEGGGAAARMREVSMAEPAGPCVEKEASGMTQTATVEASSATTQAAAPMEVCEKDPSGGYTAPRDPADSEPDVSSTEPESKPEVSTRLQLVLSPVTNYEEYSLMDPVPRYLKSCRSLVIPSDEDERGAPAEPALDRLPDEECSVQHGAGAGIDADLAPEALAATATLNGVEESLPGVADGSAENGADAIAGGHSPKPASPAEATASSVAEVAAQALESGGAATDDNDGKRDCGTPAVTPAAEHKQLPEPRGGGGSKRGAEAARPRSKPDPRKEESAAFAERVWREGWGGSKTLTLAEVYVTLGKPEKLLLEYDWVMPQLPQPPPSTLADKPTTADEARAPETAATAAVASNGAATGPVAQTEAVVAATAAVVPAPTPTETMVKTESTEVKKQPPVVHMQRMLKRLLQLVVLEANPKVHRVQSPDGLHLSPSKAGGAEAGGGGGTGGSTKSPGSARAHPARGARGSAGGGTGARNVAKPATAASCTEPEAAKTTGRSDDDLFRVPSALPPASRYGRPLSPSKEAEITFRQQLDSINQAEIFLPQHRKLRTRMLRKPLVVQRSLMPRPAGHSLRHMYSLAIVPSSSVAGTGMFSPLPPLTHPPNDPKASNLSTAIDLAAKSAGIIPGSPIREGLSAVTGPELSSAALPGSDGAGQYGGQSGGIELPGCLQDTGSGGSRRVPFVTLSTPSEGHNITPGGHCLNFEDAGTLAMVGPPPMPHVEGPLLPSPPHVPLLLEISLPGPPDDSLSQGGPHSHIGDSIIELAIGSQRYMTGDGKLNGMDGDKPLASPRNWMGSPSHEPQWFGSDVGDVGDVCLGGLLSNFCSPDKSQRAIQLLNHCAANPDLVASSLLEGNVHDSYAPRPHVTEADSPLASIICESGVDYIARFSDLAKEVSNSEPFAPTHS
ncbi:protein cramped-like [Lampetra fluviatilis]